MLITSTLINDAYRKYLLRDADEGGLNHYAQYDSMVDVERALASSPEFMQNARYLRLPKSMESWKICVIEDAKMIFVPIAKNAHTTTLDALLKFSRIEWENLPIAESAVLLNGNRENRMHAAIAENKTGLLFKDYSPEYVSNLLSDPDYIKVTLFRDPAERFYSAYQTAFAQLAKNKLAIKDVKDILDHFGCPDDGGTVLPITSFLKFVANNPSFSLNPHWAPQYTFIDGMKMDHIIPVENIDLLGKLIESRSGRSLDIGRLNTRNVQEKLQIDREIEDQIRQIYGIDTMLYEAAKERAAKPVAGV